MRNPDWGTKRTCQACGGKYYDLNRTPILCPKCQVEFDPASGTRLRSDLGYKASGGRAKSIFGKTTTPNVVETTAEAVDEDVEAPEDDEEAEDSDRDEDAVEDASELGDDEDDLAEITDADHADD